MFPVECVVRGYLSGSGWKDYQATGAVCGIALPAGLQESDQLPEPIFTPATKAELGDHDENVDFDRAAEIVGDRGAAGGAARASRSRSTSAAPSTPRERGIILADTKFEFGRDADGDDRARRRGADARLLALLAAPTATSPAARSRRSTSSTCATGLDAVGLGPDAAGARSCPTRSSSSTRAQVRRGLRADHRRAVRALARASAREGRAS